MKNQYIKFIEGDEKDLQRACKLAEKYGHKKWDIPTSLRFEGTGLLRLDDVGYYITTLNEEGLIEEGYIELKEEWQPVEGEEVAVSDISVEEAIEQYKNRNPHFYIGKTKSGRFVTEAKSAFLLVRKYIAQIPKEEKKERKLILTDSEWDNVKQVLNIN